MLDGACKRAMDAVASIQTCDTIFPVDGVARPSNPAPDLEVELVATIDLREQDAGEITVPGTSSGLVLIPPTGED